MARMPSCRGGQTKQTAIPNAAAKAVMHRNDHRKPEYTCVTSPVNCVSQVQSKIFAAAKPSRMPPVTPVSMTWMPRMLV